MSRLLRMGSICRVTTWPSEIVLAIQVFVYHDYRKVSLFASWVMMYVSRHLVYRKSRRSSFSFLSSTRCKRSEEKQQWEFLLPAQDAFDYVCISTTNFNFLYTELRLNSLKGHSLCSRVCFVLPFVLFIESSIFPEKQSRFPCYYLPSS